MADTLYTGHNRRLSAGFLFQDGNLPKKRGSIASIGSRRQSTQLSNNLEPTWELAESDKMVAKGDEKSGGLRRKGGGDGDVAVISVGGGYANEAFKDDGDAGGPTKPAHPAATGCAVEDDVPKGKFKLSRGEKWRILKNVAAVSLSFMVQFTAFQGTANLQSSINAKEGLGTVSLSAIYAALVVSCIFVPTFLIKRLTVKWTLCLSLLCYAPYIASQFYPRFYTLVPAGVLLGLGAAPMWAAKATYLTQVAGVYAKLTDQSVDGIVVRFFGFFFLAWQTAELWGNLISSLVFSSGAHGGGGGHSTGHGANATLALAEAPLCGAEFCTNLGGNANIPRPPDAEIFTISAIYLACIFAASVMVAVLVDPLSRWQEYLVQDANTPMTVSHKVQSRTSSTSEGSDPEDPPSPVGYGEKQRRADSQELSGIQLLSATALQLKKPYQQLLIPITVWIGMEQAFIGADFTQAYVSCAYGVHNIGYVMICFGVVNAICSVVFGSIMKFIGRCPLLILGALVHAGLIFILLHWRPSAESPVTFFAISGMWGVGDAVWQTQVNGLYGTLFRRNKEAAFSNYRLWESAGFVVAYAYSNHLCARMKLYVMFVVLCLGMVGYLVVELLHKKKKQRMKKLAEDPKAAEVAAQEAKANNVVEETDDEKDDIDDDIIITHL